MKLKNMLIIFSIFFIILCISSVSASENDTPLSIDDTDMEPIQSDDINEVSLKNDASNNEDILCENSTGTDVNTNSSTTDATTDKNTPTTTSKDTTKKTEKTQLYVTGTGEFIKKSNKYFKIKLVSFDEKKNKLVFHKNVKVTVKVKIGKKTKTYNVKSNSKGIIKVFNVKKLKVGSYKTTITTNDERYKLKDTGNINIYKKKKKTITIKMDKRKKVKGDYIDTFKITKKGEYDKGVYAQSYNAKNPLDGNPHTFVLKAKFFFKNKKTGKIKTKTVKTKNDKKYLWDVLPYAKLIKGYKPIKTKIWYVTR